MNTAESKAKLESLKAELAEKEEELNELKEHFGTVTISPFVLGCGATFVSAAVLFAAISCPLSAPNRVTNVEVYYDKMLNVEGNVDSYVVNDLKRHME